MLQGHQSCVGILLHPLYHLDRGICLPCVKLFVPKGNAILPFCLSTIPLAGIYQPHFRCLWSNQRLTFSFKFRGDECRQRPSRMVVKNSLKQILIKGLESKWSLAKELGKFKRGLQMNSCEREPPPEVWGTLEYGVYLRRWSIDRPFSHTLHPWVRVTRYLQGDYKLLMVAWGKKLPQEPEVSFPKWRRNKSNKVPGEHKLKYPQCLWEAAVQTY